MSKKLLDAIVEAIEDKKGEDIVALDLSHIDGAVCEKFVICTATSTVQVGAIADGIERDVLEKTGEKVWRSDGRQNCLWVAVDYGDIMVHVLLEEMRDYYRLEELWCDAKRIKL